MDGIRDISVMGLNALARHKRPSPQHSGTELRVQKRAARRANSAGRSLGPKGRSGIWGDGKS